MITTFIYALAEPNDISNIRYIGKSNLPKTRYSAHITKYDKEDQYSTHKNNWIRSLINKGEKPVLIILDEVPKEEWEYWEKFYYDKYKENNNLTNVQACIGSGGNGNTTGSSNKETINKRIKENPEKYRCKPILKIDYKTGEIINTYESARICCEAEKFSQERLRNCINGFVRRKGKETKVNHIRGFKYIHK